MIQNRMGKLTLAAALAVGFLFAGAPQASVLAAAPSDIKAYLDFSNFTNGTHEGTHALGNGALVLHKGKLLSGTDTLGKYNGGEYFYGSYTTEELPVNYEEAIPSWQANTPPGTWIEVELQSQVDGVWSKWYSMGVWHEGDAPFKRHSIDDQGDDTGTVWTDTLSLEKSATAVRARINLFTTDKSKSPIIRGLGVTFANGKDLPGVVPSAGLVSDLDVPKRSQMVFPDGGEVWCSPTSTSMVMAYWSNITHNPFWNQTVPTVVNGVWDYVYDGAGNWPYNTAYASSQGLYGKVARMSSLAEVEQWTKAGVPVVVSIAYKKGQLDHSPIPSTSGHLLVVRGFDENGNVLTNDPAAASDDAVNIEYDRFQFERAWLKNSNGTTYLIYPYGWKTPTTNGHW
jgi:hypothetical protein